MPGIDQAIQHSIAPAFLLTGIFGLLNVLTGRLGRLIDRDRSIRNGIAPPLEGEGAVIARRSRCLHTAIGGCVLAALLLCLLVAVSFVGAFLGLRLAWAMAALLVGAMGALMVVLTLFLAEVRLATRHLPRHEHG